MYTNSIEIVWKESMYAYYPKGSVRTEGRI